jgi:bifunctional UDP-N-acetylglucosamine pyrophosphorylase/glucosamine-1-phosphate N-acetyltransferase
MVAVVILAAGRGARMRSSTPKPLHQLGGLSLLEQSLSLAQTIASSQTVVVGSQALFNHPAWSAIKVRSTVVEVLQPEPAGTGDAVRCALLFIQAERILILHSDMPFIRSRTRDKLLESNADLTISVAEVNDSKSHLGRVILNGTAPIGIVEAKNATPEQLNIGTCNVAAYSISYECLMDCLPFIGRNDKSNEYYFTDIVRIAYQRGFTTSCIKASADEAFGIDSPEALKCASSKLQQILRKRFDEVTIQGNVTLSLDTRIGNGSFVDNFCVFGPRVLIGKNVKIHPFCVLSDCTIEDNCEIGPFAHIHKNSIIRADAVVGNFVEVKHSEVGGRSKAKHLSYIGDATLGARVNIGAGVVFCNYDGIRKHPSTVGDNASIGANSSIIAPLNIGANAYVGAGSVITEDVPPSTLAVSRAPQKHNAEWVKKRAKANDK